MSTTNTPTAATDDGAPKHVYESTQRLVYNTRKPVPIRDVIIALQGLDGLLKPVPLVLSTLTGVEIESSEFLIHSLETGSLIEDIVVRFFFKDRAKLDEFVDKLAEKKGVKSIAIAAVLGGLVGYGLHLATGNRPASTITATNSVIFQNGAGVMNVSPEAFQGAIAAAVAGDKKRVAESALKLASPVRADPQSSVSFGVPDAGAAPALSIPWAAVTEAPARSELEPNERVEEYKNTELIVRATDLDNRTRGWAGRLGTREERLPIELDPSVAEAELFGRTSVRVDAALVFREKGRSRELKPARIYVRKVHAS